MDFKDFPKEEESWDGEPLLDRIVLQYSHNEAFANFGIGEKRL